MSTLKVVPDQAESLADRVASEVRAQMARTRMTQVQLAEVLDLPQTAISRRLRGKIPFRVDELEKVAAALGVHPAQLFGGTPHGTQPPPTITDRYSHRETTVGNPLTTSLVGSFTPRRVAA